MKKYIFLLLVSFLIISCKKENKPQEKQNNTVKEVIVEEKTDTVEHDYPELIDVPEDFELIFSDGYLFSDEIQLDEIYAYKSSQNRYNFLLHLNDSKNYKEVENYTLGFVVYPKDLSVLVTAKQKKSKSISIGVKTEINFFQGEPVISIKDFEINTNEFKLIKLYFYNKEDGLLNGKILRLTNVKF